MTDLLIVPELETLPDEHLWRGVFTGNHGHSHRFSFKIEACLRLGLGVISGTGVGLDFPRQIEEPRTLEIVGSTSFNQAEFDLWFDASFVRRSAFTCTGLLSHDEERVEGTWFLGCFSNCGCKGGGGNFLLERVRRTKYYL